MPDRDCAAAAVESVAAVLARIDRRPEGTGCRRLADETGEAWRDCARADLSER